MLYVFSLLNCGLCGQIIAKKEQNRLYLSLRYRRLHSFKTIGLNRVSIFFHEIFRIDVELNFDLNF